MAKAMSMTLLHIIYIVLQSLMLYIITNVVICEVIYIMFWHDINAKRKKVQK
jgi:hypothetical protein